MEPKFVHLRVHTAYSLSEGAMKVPALVHKLHEQGIPAVAVTDTANMFGGKAFSKYASDDTYIKKQKEDIEELSSMFRNLMEDEDKGGIDRYTRLFIDNFVAQSDFKASYVININDKKKTLVIDINNGNIDCNFGQKDDAEVSCRLDNLVLEKIVQGNQTFQGAFMSGSMTAKGNFKNIRMLDQCFKF